MNGEVIKGYGVQEEITKIHEMRSGQDKDKLDAESIEEV